LVARWQDEPDRDQPLCGEQTVESGTDSGRSSLYPSGEGTEDSERQVADGTGWACSDGGVLSAFRLCELMLVAGDRFACRHCHGLHSEVSEKERLSGLARRCRGYRSDWATLIGGTRYIRTSQDRRGCGGGRTLAWSRKPRRRCGSVTPDCFWNWNDSDRAVFAAAVVQ
jgi:hypothetical protein